MNTPTDSEPGHLQEVADGVHAFVQPPGGWCVNNAGVIPGPEGAVVIDTAATERRTRALQRAIDRVSASGLHVLVNTHHHSDHTFGNVFFPRTVPVIAHESTRDDIIANGLGLTMLFPDVDWGDVGVRAPSVTFTTELTVQAGPLDVRLQACTPAHTRSDVVAWVPARDVLFAGDVVMSGVTPFAMMGSVSGSIEVLTDLLARRPQVVVPGHGAPGGPELIEANLAYFRWVARLAETGHLAGLSPLQFARDVEANPFAEWLDAERLVANVARAVAELEGLEPGGPLDLGSVFGQLIDFNGGPPASAA
ncbi:MBL fold metallo-hydrolase [Flexivirga sp. ID2601S]|uniref:MBL fold metallo-hydrolase n=1 Tax=Flexivirga aerilata TaxID=1656889 RepID=A0A849ANA9_9MICO|nr:MBL fold metallo-hydrolase [Flexivirga aerilata]NNG38292.1 MBL fold metallo-hydrolase [Flexivirga aerilata]